MINSNELRIGNFVLAPNGEIKKVENIYDRYFNMLHDGDGVGGGYLLEVYNGIPLTPKILEQCGFEILTSKEKGFTQDTYTYKGKISLVVAFDGERLSVSFWQGNEKKYLHQFQNFFYFLTGEELILKEEELKKIIYEKI